MKSYFFLFLIIFFLPLVNALDCNDTSNAKICQEIQDSKLTADEKTYLLEDIISEDKLSPDLLLIKDWNSKLKTDVKPYETKTQNNGYIKDAWVEILAITPSVLVNNQLMIDTQGEVKIGYDYNVEIPSSTASGDCKTERSIDKNTATATTYLNNDKLGEGHTILFSTNTDHVQFITDYVISLITKIKHYQWEKVYYYKYGKKKYSWSCTYASTEYKTDSVTVSRKKTVNVYKPTLTANFQLKGNYWETKKADFTFSDAVITELRFKDSSYAKYNYVFSETELLQPVNVLQLKADKKTIEKQQNLIYSHNDITIADTEGCQIIQYSFFHRLGIPCNLNQNSFTFTIKTDKTAYNDGEKINLEITPQGQDYVVEYGNNSSSSKGTTSLIATYPLNRIVVKSQGKEVQKLIHVKNEEPLSFLFSLSMFGLLNYTFVGFIKRFWGYFM